MELLDSFSLGYVHLYYVNHRIRYLRHDLHYLIQGLKRYSCCNYPYIPALILKAPDYLLHLPVCPSYKGSIRFGKHIKGFRRRPPYDSDVVPSVFFLILYGKISHIIPFLYRIYMDVIGYPCRGDRD